jgi:excinuclease ABC subunit C
MNNLKLPQLPHIPGVYLMRDNTGGIIYVGKARDLKKRVSSYFQPGRQNTHDMKTGILVSVARHVDYVPTESERGALVLERKLIARYMPTFNIMWKDDKSYPYVALTMGEDFPRLFLTRERKHRQGTIYFGPYPNVSQVRSLLRWAWRKKLFPLRPCKFEIKEGQPLPYAKVKSCLYLHTGECSAPCLGKISSANYKKIARRAEWFFRGEKEKMAAQLEKEMKTLSKRTKYEEAAALRDQMAALQHMDEQVTFREMNESDLEERVRGTRAVQELRLALGLKKSPERIECFDISHIQGTEKVASMVSFLRGRPDKSQYRKFIIRTVDGIDDFKSMAEVVGRRYRRLKEEGKPMPDLVLIDGGKGQLSSALKAIQELELSGPPNDRRAGLQLAALAKEEEEVFLPGRSESIRLPMDSLALLLLRHVRDEAHRFAITFHRKRRSKLTLGDLKLS